MQPQIVKKIGSKDLVFYAEVVIFWILLAGLLNMRLNVFKTPFLLVCAWASFSVTLLSYISVLTIVFLNFNAQINLWLFYLDGSEVSHAILNAGNNISVAFFLNYTVLHVLIAISPTEPRSVWLNILYASGDYNTPFANTIFYIAASASVTLLIFCLLLVLFYNTKRLLMDSPVFTSFTDFAVICFVFFAFTQRIILNFESKLCGQRPSTSFDDCIYSEKTFDISIDVILEIVVVCAGLMLQQTAALKLSALCAEKKTFVISTAMILSRLCVVAETAVLIFYFNDIFTLESVFYIATLCFAVLVCLFVLIDVVRVLNIQSSDAMAGETKQRETITPLKTQLYLPSMAKIKISKHSKDKKTIYGNKAD